MAKNQNLTIVDLAKLTGYSKSTISRVLTNNPKVKQSTRDKILSYMEKENFLPNSLASSLATGSTKIISLLVSDIRNAFFSEITWSIHNYCLKHDYFLVIFNTEYSPQKERYFLQLSQQWRFAGVIFISAVDSDKLNDVSVPLVLVNRTFSNFLGNSVTIDNYRGGAMAAEHLIDYGHKDIGAITGPTQSTASMDRIKGFLDALRKSNIKIREEIFSEGNLTYEAGYNFGRKVAQLESKPTALFAGNDQMALGIMSALNRFTDNSRTKEISIVGFDNIPFADETLGNLTTVENPQEELARLSVDILINSIKNPSMPVAKIVLEPKLIVRGSSVRIK